MPLSTGGLRGAAVRLFALTIACVVTLQGDAVAQPDCSDIPQIPGRIGWSQRIAYYDFQFAGNNAIPRGAIDQIKKGFEEATRVFGAGNKRQFRVAVTPEQKQNAAAAGIILTNEVLNRQKGQAAEARSFATPPDATGSTYLIRAVIAYDFANRDVYEPTRRDGLKIQSYI